MTDEFYQCVDCGAVERFKWRNLPFAEIGADAKSTLKAWFLSADKGVTSVDFDFHPDSVTDPMLETYFNSENGVADDLCEIFESAREKVCKDCGSSGPFVLHSYIE